MESVKKARDRFRKYPLLLTSCTESGSLYANCVLAKESIKKGDCEKEFNNFKKCLLEAAKKHRTKL